MSPAPALSRRTAGLALLGMWACFFAPQLLSGDVPYYRDHLVTNVPLRHYIRERLLAGELPQWFPSEGLGVPVIGQIALGTFHPLNLAATPLPAPDGEKVVLLLSYLMALVGAYRLAREASAGRVGALAGAAAFAFGGFSLGVSSIIAYVLSFAALPWMSWAALRAARRQRLSDAALLGLLWSLIFFSGDAVSFLLGCGVAAAAFARTPSWRAVGLLALGGVVAALLVGVELLPATAVSAEAVRAVGTPAPTLGVLWALHPLRIPELVVAGWVPDEVRDRVTGELLGGGTALFLTTLFAGGLTLALAAFGVAGRQRVAVAFLAISGTGLWLSLGDRGGLLPLVQRLVPLFGKFRYPERYLSFFWLGLAVLAALGVEVAARHPQRGRRWLAGGAIGTGMAALGLWLTDPASALWSLSGRALTDPAVRDVTNAAWAGGAAWTAGFLALGALALTATATRPRLGALLPVLVFAELLRGNGPHLPLVDWQLFERPNGFVEAIRARAQPRVPQARVSSEVPPGYSSRVTSQTAEKERWVNGMLHLFRSDAASLFGVNGLNHNLGGQLLRHAIIFGVRDEGLLRWAPTFNGCYRVAADGRGPAAGEELIARAAELGLELLAVPCQPRARLVQALAAANRDQAIAMLSQPGLEGSTTVVWEGAPAVALSDGTVDWLEDRPELIALEVQAVAPAALFLADEYAVGWSARVDGLEVPIHPAMIAARGVEVPAGKHRVTFEYHTPRLLPGAVSTLAGLVLAASLWLATRRRPVGAAAPRTSPMPSPE